MREQPCGFVIAGAASLTWWYRNSTTGGSFNVTVSSSTGTCTGCRLGYWVDLNGDGDLADTNEAYVANVTAGTQTVYVDTTGVTLVSNLYARFRLYDANYSGSILPTGLVPNGEVADYLFNITPTAVGLASFTAAGRSETILLRWETASELGNLGFNLYRATAIHGGRTRINADLIPSRWPGSPVGGVYSYVDAGVTPGVDYFYSLESVDLHGDTDLYGPVSAQAGSPPGYRIYLPRVRR